MATDRDDMNADGAIVSRRWLLGVAIASTTQVYAAAPIIRRDRDEAIGTSATQAATTSSTALADAGPLQRLGVSQPLHYRQDANVALTGTTSGATLSGTVPGMVLGRNSRTFSGTPTARSFLLTESLDGVARDTLLFAPEAAARTMRLGMNMAGLSYYSVNRTFIDHFKQAATGETPAIVDRNEMPVKLKPDKPAQYIVPLADGRTSPIKMRLITDGDVDFEINCFPAHGYTGPGYGKPLVREGRDLVFTHTGPESPLSVNYLTLKAIRRAPTYMALVRDEHAGLYRAGKMFQPELIAALQGFSHVRFMDWSGVNHADPAYTPDGNLSFCGQGDYGQPSYIDRVVPLSAQVQLCKEAHVGGWFNIHITLSDEQYKARRPLYDELLGQGLSVRNELSNEIWNGQFAQHRIAQTRAQALGYTDNAYEAAEWYNGYRSAQLAKLDRGRGYKWAVGCQPSSQFKAHRIIDGIAAAGGDKADFSIWTTTNYTGGILAQAKTDIDAAMDTKREEWARSLNYDAAFDNVLNYIGKGSYSAERIASLLREAASVAKANGWSCETYEGNILHLNTLPWLIDRPVFEKLFYKMPEHPLAKPAMTVNLEVAQACGISCATLFDWDSHPDNSNAGRFGLYPLPAFDALREWIAASG